MAFGERPWSVAHDEFQGDLSFELDAMDAVLGHGFHPLKARQRRQIANLQTVHRHRAHSTKRPKSRQAAPTSIHEIKHDGFRILARKDADRVKLITRNGYSPTQS